MSLARGSAASTSWSRMPRARSTWVTLLKLTLGLPDSILRKVSRVMPARSETCCAAEHHAPPAHVLSELRHLTVDPVARHVPPFAMTTIVARTGICGDVARRIVRRTWRGQRFRQAMIVPRTPEPLAGGLFNLPVQG